jgi:subtilisin-like proprotein convertase family protein
MKIALGQVTGRKNEMSWNESGRSRRRRGEARGRDFSALRAVVDLGLAVLVMAALGMLSSCSDDDSGNNENGLNNNTVAETLCGDGTDDDGDGLIDCEDPDCASDPRCEGLLESDCSNGTDDDGDGLIDCADDDCDARGPCEASETTCTDNIDNDGDGSTDCNDPSCQNDEACEGIESVCDDTIDNDGDGETDCADPDCSVHVFCQAESSCLDGQDDDGDGLTDCADDDCHDRTYCEPSGEETCDDAIDNDGDGATDCADTDCAEVPVCSGPEQICDDEVDNDGDGATDCADGDCQWVLPCEVAEATCGDGFDNDGDGATDCADDDCQWVLPCEVAEATCGDGLDNDGDGATDCADDDCRWVLPCEDGEATCGDGFDNDGDGLTDCADGDCQWVFPCEVAEATCGDGLDNDGDGQTDCVDDDCQWVFPCEAVEQTCGDGLDNDGDGAVDCADGDCQWISPCEIVEEMCGDGLDNDGDGGTDCADPDCAGDPCGPHGSICDQGGCLCPGGQSAEHSCSDGQDNDCDGDVDCADTDCDGQVCGPNGEVCESGQCVCPGGVGSEASCGDGLDDDCDGLIDCQDPDCESASCGAAGAVCQSGVCVCPGGQSAEHSCSDGQDNDCDGQIDCADQDCDGVGCGAYGLVCEQGACVCPGGATIEPSCKDGQDDDCDGAVDCQDADCDAELCTSGGHVCQSGVCECPPGRQELAGVCVRVPQPGDLVITEIMVNPAQVSASQGQWFEIYSLADERINLEGAVIENASQSYTIGSSAVLEPSSFLVFGVEDDPALNGQVDVDVVYQGVELAQDADTLTLGYSGQILDQVVYGSTYPVAEGYSMTLHPSLFSPVENDTAGSWCFARRSYNSSDFGTPRGPNDECLCQSVSCPANSTCIEATGTCYCDAGHYDRYGDGTCVETLVIADCWLDSPLTVTVAEGETTPRIYGKVFVDGETDGAGQAAGIQAQVGYAPDGALPSDPFWLWTDMVYSSDSSTSDLYEGRLLVETTVSGQQSMDYAVRFSGDGGVSWTQCDSTGSTYSPGDAGDLTVVDYGCPPDDAYEPNDGFVQAQLLSAGIMEDGRLCSNDEDWYAIPLAAGDSLWVGLDLFHMIGDLDLAVYGPQQGLIDTSTGTGNSEAVAVLDAQSGMHYLKIYGAQGAYSLDLQVNPSQPLCHYSVDCPAQQPICESKRCRACQTTNDCGDLICDWQSGECVECVSSSDCEQGFGCDSDTHACELFGSVELQAQDVQLAIPDDDPQGVVSTIDVAEDHTISHLYVEVEILHGHRSDLVVVLRSPIGTEVTLHDRSGGSGDDLVGVYGIDLFVDGPGTLDDFYGESTQGQWSLTVSDNDVWITGDLVSWGLSVVP